MSCLLTTSYIYSSHHYKVYGRCPGCEKAFFSELILLPLISLFNQFLLTNQPSKREQYGVIAGGLYRLIVKVLNGTGSIYLMYSPRVKCINPGKHKYLVVAHVSHCTMYISCHHPQ